MPIGTNNRSWTSASNDWLVTFSTMYAATGGPQFVYETRVPGRHRDVRPRESKSRPCRSGSGVGSLLANTRSDQSSHPAVCSRTLTMRTGSVDSHAFVYGI